jgi:hypothetical protein
MSVVPPLQSEVWARYQSEEHARTGLRFQTGESEDNGVWFVREEASEDCPEFPWVLRRANWPLDA